MVTGLHKWRKIARGLFLGTAVAAVSACQVTAPTIGAGPSVDRDEPVPVALLLPYGSGKQGDQVVAKAIEDAARLATADLEGAKIDLRVYNTAGSAATGASVAAQAVNDGAQVVLGPLYADVAASVGVALSDTNVPVLAFSNNTSIAGGNVFVLGSTFDNTAQRMLSFAASQGRNRIVVLHGNDTTGTVAKAAVSKAAGSSGVTIASTISYELSQAGVVGAIPTVRSSLRSSGSTGLFLTSPTSGALPLFAELLPEAGVNTNEVKFMGLSRWDIPAEALGLKGLQGGWFALPDPGLAAQFNNRFQAATGRAAHPLAGLGYDGISALGTIIASGANAIDSNALTRPSGFAGVNGVFRLKADGTNERALAIAQIVNNQVQVISPAPRRFGSAGS